MACFGFFVVGLAGIMLMWGDGPSYKFIAATAEKAEELGLRCADEEEAVALKEFVDSLSLYQMAENGVGVYPIFMGEIDGVSPTILESVHKVSDISMPVRSVVILNGVAEHMPDFIVIPGRGW